MRFLATSLDTGAVKEVICCSGTDTSKKDATQPQLIKDVCLEPLSSSATRVIHLQLFNSKYVLATRLGGSLCVYENSYSNNEGDNFNLLHTYMLETSKDDIPIALIKLENVDIVLVAYKSGNVYIVNFNDGKFDLDPISFKVPGDKQMSDFVNDPNEVGVFAYGGEENNIKLIRINQGPISKELFKSKNQSLIPSVIFSSKNVKNNYLDMRVPISISKIKFLDHPEGIFKFLAVTKQGDLQIYDTSHGKRPVESFKLCSNPITNIAIGSKLHDELTLTDTRGLLAKYSLSMIDKRAFKENSATAGDIFRPSLKLLGKFSSGGNTGTINGIKISDTGILASGGLDRYLRVFNTETREILAKVYLGVEISDVLILSSTDAGESVISDEPDMGQSGSQSLPKSNVEDGSSDGSDDDEYIWKRLEENGEESRDKKRRKVK
ncbi:uncharacterized protein PRCAT00004432001 [Priceomyces carsonii]|uniref:uncharacterized protein n=1 Tax=Priceomyces carsonii TaxID=28549 RepID=UPI002ED8E505|nr:unnamed protein product [Priceomyces carsonii]